MQNKTILLISPEPWGVNFVSKHHYANYLAKNNTVYFLNPATGFAKNPFKGIQFKETEIKRGLRSIDYVNLLPRLNNTPNWIQKIIYKKQARQIQKQIGISKFDIVWSFDPNRFFDQKNWAAKNSIYHTVDFHPSSKNEKLAIHSADLFLGVADLILKDHEAYRKGELIPHAADIDGFQTTEKVDLPGNNSIRAIYTGNFHRHINYDLLLRLVKSNANVDFIMVGPTMKSNLAAQNNIKKEILDVLIQQPNIFFIGSVSANELMNYLSNCHINLVLFKKKNEKIHCSPHKLMAYFYTGNVTLSNYIDAHKHTDKDIILMCQTEEETIDTFNRIKLNLNEYNASNLRVKRKDFAISNSYDKRITEISTLLENLKNN